MTTAGPPPTGRPTGPGSDHPRPSDPVTDPIRRATEPLRTLEGSLPATAYLDRVTAALAPHDFALERTFAAVSLCRDELTQPLMGDIAARYGLPFSLGGLGAVPSLGRTGWEACLSHVPHLGGRGHLLVFGFPHIGIGPSGVIGESLRRHQDAPTPTCGALVALLGSLRDRSPAPARAAGAAGAAGAAAAAVAASGPGCGPGCEHPHDLADAEARRLAELVAAELAEGDTDIIDLTFAAARAVNREIWAQLDALTPWEAMDVAVFTGLQIQVPDGPDRILSLDARVRTGADASEHELGI